MSGQIPDDNKRVDWNTPGWTVNKVKRVFGGKIGLDPCSNPNSIVGAVKSYCLPEKNGLLESWNEPDGVFINPPYGRCFVHKTTLTLLDPKLWKDLTTEERAEYYDTSIEDWIEKAADVHEAFDVPFILLIPAYVNARYFQKHVFGRASAICFPDGRFKFEGAPSTAAFHVCLPLYGNADQTHRFKQEFAEHTVVVL